MAGITCPVRVEQERESSQSQRELEPESESCQGLWDPGVAEKGDNSRAEDVCEESLVDVYQFRPPFISVSLSFSMILIIYLVVSSVHGDKCILLLLLHILYTALGEFLKST